ncbi:lysozyme [Amycolatopsis acidiphila]|uniref:lysozyme n=1 Tax=Amycolatopsis acidiphila TaxID=715473 RepID=A0A558A2K6_9PSEU|nr:lysozyme [Amycolatopsis acidiphila]TVT18485.1 lysozyme [Amycolatopsis acidiphila]UIJ60002.1 lysozyme [Amycolatopsis acidiphila]GHG61937.1 lysozyme [Amycolatopsis acidiphila]
MSTSPRRRCQIAAAVCAASAAALLSGLITPADADDATSIDAYVAQYDHEMGSQIKRVEGDQSNPGTKVVAQRPQGLDVDGVIATATVAGIDVSGHQGNVDWNSYWGQGVRFAYVKATENTNYTNPYFAQQYNGSYDVGMIRGAYHFATPDTSTGAAQANYFVDHGGGWSADGRTLPGALDMEYNPYGATCYGKSKSAMTAWIKDFSDTYHARTNKYPAIYSSTSWWGQCVDGDFSSTNPLWVARYASSVGTLPYNWGTYTFWQYSSSPIDQDTFNGSIDRLVVLATNHD